MLNLKKFSINVCAMSLFALIAGSAQAAVVSIDDLAESLGLAVAGPNDITTGQPTDPAPGSGTQIDLTQPTDSANKLSAINYNANTEFLSFTFADQVNWGGDFFAYRYFTEAGSGTSDLFVIQGIANTTPDYITFSSADTLTGNFATDAANIGLVTVQGATPVDLGTLDETGDWQLAFNTGVDQYYLRSDAEAPEPTTMLLLGSGLLGVVASRKLRKV